MAAGTMRTGAPATAAASVRVADTHSYVDWGAIFAGAVVAAAISFLMMSFGSAIGLSLVSPYRGESASMTVIAIAVGIWIVWVQASSFMAGGYVAGRLRRRIGDATPHEVEIRDGLHGLAMWGIGTLVAALVTAVVVTGALSAGAIAAASTGPSTSANSSNDRLASAVDLLFRSDRPAPATNPEVARAEIMRLLAAAATGGQITPEDRAYMARVVSQQIGLAQPQAERRVDDVIAKTKAAADKARKSGIIAAFLTAASLLISGVAGWWAATLGGRHRDEGTVFANYTRW